MRIPTVKFVHDRRHNGTVEVRIAMNCKSYYFSTGIKAKSMTRLSYEEHERLQIIRNNIEGYINHCLKTDTPVSVAAIRVNALQEAARDEFIEFCNDRVNDREMRASTRKKYDVFLNSLAEYGKLSTFQDLTPGNILTYLEWIRHNKPVNDAGVYNYYKCLRTLVNEAVLFEKINSNPCSKLRGQVKTGNRMLIEYLTTSDLDKLVNTPMPSEMMEHARDLLVFLCFTGMRYSDMIAFDINNYHKEHDIWIANSEAVKTGTVFVSQLLTPAVRILEKYNYQLPKMSNQKMNYALKSVQVVCNIKQRLHTHLGRHTFATYMLSHGAAPQNVMRMLGHSRISQTMRYAAILAKDVRSDYSKVDAVFKTAM